MPTAIKANCSPALLALFSQLIALTVTVLLVIVSPPLTIFELALVQGILAAFISYFLKMAAWWIPIQLCFLPVMVATLAFEFPPVWFGIGFITLVLVYGKTYQTQVPLYLSSYAVTQALSTYLPQKKDFSFIDLGCGCGGLLSALSKTKTNGAFHGIEAALLPYLIGKTKNLLTKSSCNIQCGDLWKQNLSHYDIVYAYLSPAPMKMLWEKICGEMRPGSIFISNTFMIPGVAPDSCIEINDFSGSTLYIWRIKSDNDALDSEP
ncbi:class I SAM-dependent methyltransferase [Nitrosomonas sp.]|uniref:class I SAM-dependent methyltransferase n=1 Tax=Nitrosomonas sp. TaxID=42353 RepID=UPI00284D5854|nr:class I SAM-dependent methyltransferase [Nitrosomonas sp.]MDR4513335.1 class I SAM-dependent methyltransferase [Nitrosomonas sp.]